MSEFERPAHPNHEAKTPSDTSPEEPTVPPQGNPERTPTPPHGQEHDPDTILMKLQQREERRMFRPVQLYKTAYQLEEERALHEQLLSGTPFLERLFQTDDLREEIREKARADLTPKERERLEIEKTISDLKSTRGISRRLNHIESIFHEDDERLYTLYQRDPEFMTPIIDAWMKRPARLKKAQARIKRIRQSRGEDKPQEE